MFIPGVDLLFNVMRAEGPCLYFQLEKSFQDTNESEDCNTALSDKFIDLESNDVSILHQAAIILQNRVSKTEGLQQKFFSPSELCLERHNVNFKTIFFFFPSFG